MDGSGGGGKTPAISGCNRFLLASHAGSEGRHLLAAKGGGRPHVGLPPAHLILFADPHDRTREEAPGGKRARPIGLDDWAGDEMGARGGLPHVGLPPAHLILFADPHDRTREEAPGGKRGRPIGLDDWAGDEMGGLSGLPHVGLPLRQFIRFCHIIALLVHGGLSSNVAFRYVCETRVCSRRDQPGDLRPRSLSTPSRNFGDVFTRRREAG